MAAGLRFDRRGQAVWNINHGSSLAAFKHFASFFGGIEGAEHLQILAGSQIRPHRATDRTIVVIDDINRDFCHHPRIVKRCEQQTGPHNQTGHQKEFGPSENDGKKIDESSKQVHLTISPSYPDGVLQPEPGDGA